MQDADPKDILSYVAPRQDTEIARRMEVENLKVARQIWSTRLKTGDRYLFENIKARCPGDAAARNIGDMSFKVQ